MSHRAVLLFGALLLSALFAAPEAAAQTTRQVDDDQVQCPAAAFTTIQAAVNASAPGDIVEVCAGTYAELVTVDRTLTVRGARFGVDARDASRTATPAPASESVVTGNAGTTAFNITASNVVIDGFTVQGNTNINQFGFGILMGAGTTGTQILNNVIQDNINGLNLANTGASQVIIRDNLFRNNNQSGAGSGHGIYTDQFVSGGSATNILIDDNTFEDNDSAGVGLSATSPGVQSNITISNNIMDENGNAVYAFFLTSSSIRRNTITNSVGSQIGILGGVSGLTITENFIEDGDARGIRIGDFVGSSPNSGLSATCNSIENNAGAGLDNDNANSSPGPGNANNGTIDARFDWWGSPTGPTTPNNPGGTGEEIVDPDNEVDFTPFLTSGTDASPAIAGFQCPNTAVAGSAIISEFRFRGPGPNASQNEYIEIYNASGSDIVVADASPGGPQEGWALVATDNPNVAKFVIPAGTIIPARGHFLGVNSDGYSLSGYPSACACTPTLGDATYTDGIPNGAGIALFRTANPASFNAGNQLDAVGFAISGVGFSEGTPLSPAGGITDNSEHAFVRKMAPSNTNGNPQDTNNNEADFAFVATDGAIHSGRQATLGAPGPENLISPVKSNGEVSSNLIAPTLGASQAPNRERDFNVQPCADQGNLFFRITVTNNTTENVTRLRYRVVDITTLNSPGYSPGGPQADLRVRNAGDETLFVPGRGTVQVNGTNREEPPQQNQPLCGGLNTSLSDTADQVGTPLAPAASRDLVFRTGIMQGGRFRYFINIEFKSAPVPPAP